MTKLWIKTPYPYDKPGDGKWVECTTPYEKRMWQKHNKRDTGLPTAKQKEVPDE